LIQDKVAFILQRAEKDESFKRMFFKKLSTTENPYPWFEQLQKAGYLDPRTNNKNPVLEGDHYSVPYWFALDFLENLAAHLSKKPDEKILDQLVALIDSIIDFREEGKRIENPNTDYKVIKIVFKLPITRITKKHIDFIKTALANKFSAVSLLSSEIENTVIPYLLDNSAKNLLLEAMKIVLKYKIDKKDYLSFLNFTSILDDYWFSELIQKNGSKIIDICGISLANIIVDLIQEIMAKDSKSFSFVAIPAIEDNPQNFLENNYQLQITHLLRRTLESLKPPAQESLLKTLVKSDLQIFQRVSIHLISYYYEAYGQLFWQWDGNPLEEYGLKHEIYELISKNKTNFSSDQIHQLTNWIESIKLPATREAPEGSDKHLQTEAHAKLEWLSALDGIDDKEIVELGEKYSKIYPYKIEHPGYIWWSEPVQVSQIGAPEVFPSEVISKSNTELVQYIKSYKPQKETWYQSREDIVYSFSSIVRENPSKFATDMGPFIDLDLAFQEALVSGFVDAWRNNKPFPLKGLFDFITEATATSTFRESSSMEKNFLIKSIGNLIFEGTRDEKHVFDEEFLSICETILLRLVNNAYSIVKEDSNDVLTAVLNSPLGAVYYAMVAFSLRFAKVYRKNKEEKWVTSIKTYYQSVIETNRTVEFQVCLGTFLPQLYYLDKAWVTENIDKLFPKENEKMWEYGFSSYLFHSTTLSREIYCLLRENQHYKKALKKTEGNLFPKLPQHVCLAYLNDLESLSKGSLLSDLITGKNVTYLLDLIRFLWHLRGKLEPKMKEKIKPLWGAIVGYISNLPNTEKYKDVLAELSYWLSLVENIDNDIVNWMKLSNKYMNDRSSMFYLEYLNSHVSKNPELVAEIFYDLVSNTHYFPYIKQEEVIALVKSLFESGQEEKAKRICTLYLSAGFEFLRKVFEENKDKSESKQAIDSNGLKETVNK